MKRCSDHWKSSSFAVAALAIAVAVFIGAPEIRKLRKEIGDDSFLTAFLSGDLFRKGH